MSAAEVHKARAIRNCRTKISDAEKKTRREPNQHTRWSLRA
jgi:hypothetical protein